MEIMFYNEWQKEGSPLGPSFAAADACLHRRQSRRHTPCVKASARSFFSSSAQFASPTAAATKSSIDGFLWSVLHQQVVVPLCGEGRGVRSRSRWSKQSQLADSTVFTTLNSFQRCSVPLTGCPQEAEELFVATERNAKLRYEGYKKLSEM